MGRILSGVQPTGYLHLGNYLGAVKNWVGYQKSHECFFCVVDLHALTASPDPLELSQATRQVAACYLASGIDPSVSFVFPQSAVPEHTELAWYLNCLTPLGWLGRMTQFKDKAGKDRDMAVAGLFNYPVLQAADILVYKATHVPTGEDQKQHLELARDIAGLFNRRYKEGYFPLPEPCIQGPAPRVMSLRDGAKKMSKSDPSDFSRINLGDEADAVALKIRKAKTDPFPLPQEEAEFKGRPEAENLITLYAALADIPVKQVLQQLGGVSFGRLKEDLTQLIVEKILPIGQEIKRLMADSSYLDEVLKKGALRARGRASSHMQEVRELMGLHEVR